MNSSEPKFQTLVISRLFRATPERLFAEWTEPQRIRAWWGPKGFSSPVCKVDFREGGRYLVCIQSPAGENYWSTGVFQKIVPNHQVVATDSFSDQHGNIIEATTVGLPAYWPSTVLINVRFEREGTYTRFTLQHKGLPTPLIESCRVGWTEAFDKLDLILKSK